MKILILNWRDIRNPSSGGAEVVTLKYAEAWVSAGHEVTWFSSSYLKAKKEEVIQGIKIERRGNWITVFFHAFFYYQKNKKSFDLIVDEIHGIPFFTPFYVKKPILAFIHEVAIDIWDYMFSFPLNIFGKFFERLSLSFYRSILFLTVSDSTKKDLLKLGIKEISVIHSGVTVPFAKVLPEKEKKHTFLFVSRIVRMKGIEDVMRAFRQIKKHDKEAVLWILGTGEAAYIKNLHTLIKTLGLENDIVFWGRVDENKKRELMSRAHLLLHASIKEGWGLVVVEAASQGTPAIVYNVGGLRDSVKHNITGLVLRQNTPEEMARNAHRLLQDRKQYERFQKNCLNWAKSLDWKRATDKSLLLLKKVQERN